MPAVWTPAKPFRFSSGLRGKGHPDWLANRYRTMLDDKTHLNHVVSKYADDMRVDDMRVRIEDTVSSSDPMCILGLLTGLAGGWNYFISTVS